MTTEKSSEGKRVQFNLNLQGLQPNLMISEEKLTKFSKTSI